MKIVIEIITKMAQRLVFVKRTSFEPYTITMKEEQIKALELIGIQYHFDTETYDRMYDHGISPSGESAMPLDRKASTINAYNALKRAQDEGMETGFTPEQVKKSIQDTARYKYKEICRILGRTGVEL